MVDVEQCLGDLAEHLDALFDVQLQIWRTGGGCELIEITLRTVFSEQSCRRVFSRSATVRKIFIHQNIPVLTFLKHVQLALYIFHSVASLPVQNFADVELWFEPRPGLAFATTT